MATRHSTASWQRYFFVYGSIFLVVASLYFAQVVILPIVLAILLAFVLAPVVGFLQRHGIHRIISVSLVVGLATLAFIGVILAVGYQARQLMIEIPKFRTNIVSKINTLRQESDLFSDIIGIGEDLKKADLKKAEKTAAKDAKDGETVSVRIEQSNVPLLTNIASYTLEFMVNAGLVLLLVFFMLLSREDLRNRVIGVCGHCNLNTTTKALDEASQRVSRYLSMQFLVNASYGVTLGIGLFFLGVKFAFIWGIMAALLRYIPYIGPWIGAMFPLTVAFAMDENWGLFFSVLGFILVLELISNNFMEPWLYGRSIGVSEIALLVAAAFWTWLWGPLGLILSTPITACLVVFGRYVQPLSLIPHFMGNEPVMATEVTFYQRLLARDVEEANDLVEAQIKEHPVETVYDDVLLPALVQVKRYQEAGDITREDRKYILGGIRHIVDEVVEPAMDESHESSEERPMTRLGRRVRVMGLAWDPAGETGLYLLKSMMDLSRADWRIFPLQGGWGEAIDQIRREKPRILILSTMQGKRMGRVRTFCRRIKEHFPDLLILVHAWGDDNLETVREQMKVVGAEDVATHFIEGWKQVNAHVQTFLDAGEPQLVASNGSPAKAGQLQRKG